MDHLHHSYSFSMFSKSALVDDLDSNQNYQDIFDYLTSGIYPASCDIPPGPFRTQARKNFRKRVNGYSLCPDKTDLLLTRKKRNDKNNTELVTVKIVMNLESRRRVIRELRKIMLVG